MKKRGKIFIPIAPYGYVMPISLILLTFVVGSVVISLVFSFTKYNLLLDPEFIQFDNYKKMLTDPKLHLAVINTLKVMVLVVPLQVVLSVLFANFGGIQKTFSDRQVCQGSEFLFLSFPRMQS